MSEETAVLVELVGRTDIGLVREKNQDCYVIGDLDSGEPVAGVDGAPVVCGVEARGPFLVVCDGMGGAAGGEIASDLAAKVIWAEMRAAQSTTDRAVYARILRRAVRLANRRVLEEARKDPRLTGMGTTVSAAGLVGDALLLAQVGDSRAYVQRASTLTQVTRDQSIAAALIHSGRLTPKEAKASANANMILQALGVQEELDVSISIVEIRQRDVLLLCSDGLHGPVDDDRIRATMVACPDLDEAADTLVRLAHGAGAPDNVTVAIARFSGEGLRAVVSEEDLPRFTEFDPREEGVDAMTTTSWVARRLAARVGIGRDPGPPPVPATGQHPVYRGDVPELAEGALDGYPSPVGPAEARLARGSRVGLVAWAVAAVVAVGLGALLLWDII